jgi:chromosome segregation ATPase
MSMDINYPDLTTSINKAAKQQKKLIDISEREEENNMLKKKIKKLEKKIDGLEKTIDKLIDCNNDLVDVVTDLQIICKDNKKDIQSLFGETTSNLNLFFETVSDLESKINGKDSK